MKRYSDLTDVQQEAAVQRHMNGFLRCLLEGSVRYNDEANHDNLQATIDAAIAQANAMQTPWFAGEYVMDARYTPEEGFVTEEDGKLPVSGLIEAVALDSAKACYYLEEGELAIYLEELDG